MVVLRGLLAVLLALSLSGCALLPLPQPDMQVAQVLQHAPQHFSLEGRVALQAGVQSYSGRLRWTHDADTDSLLFSTPLGQGMAEVNRQGGTVWVTDAEGRRYDGQVAQDWLRDMLGTALPILEMAYWIPGHPYPGQASTLKQDEHGRASALEQQGWQLTYDRYTPDAGAWLPGRVVARFGNQVDLRLVIDRWVLH